MKHLHLILIAAVATACGDDTPGDSSTGTDDTSGSSTSSSTDPSSSTTPGTDSGTTDPTTTTTPGTSESSSADSSGTGSSSNGDDSSDSSGTGDPSALEVEIVDADAYMNCKPEVPPDPLALSTDITFDNQGGAITSVTITEARLLANGIEAATIAFTPDTFGPFDPGEQDGAALSKVEGSLMPANGCDTLECGGKYELEITFDVDGLVAVASGPITVECAF